MNVYASHVCSTQVSQKRASDALALQVVVSYHMGTGNWTLLLCESSQARLDAEPHLQLCKRWNFNGTSNLWICEEVYKSYKPTSSEIAFA